MTTLNPGQFGEPLFHGTSGYVKDNDTILPPSVSGQESFWSGHGGDEPRHHAFASPNEDIAWHFARQRPREDTRPRVYEVEHAADEHPGKDLGKDEVVSQIGFPIKRRIDTMPGRQGTFPQINWWDHTHPVGKDIWDPKKYQAWEHVDSAEVNHPSDDEITYGHRKAASGIGLAGMQKSEPEAPKPDEHQGALFDLTPEAKEAYRNNAQMTQTNAHPESRAFANAVKARRVLNEQATRWTL